MFGIFKAILKTSSPKTWVDPGTNLPVIAIHHRSAKGMKLRVAGRDPHIRVTLPHFATIDMARHFIAAHQVWILNQVSKIPAQSAFQHGSQVTLLGEHFTLCHTPGKRSHIWVEGTTIHITGPHEKWEPYFKKWMIQQIRNFVVKEAEMHASTIGVRFQHISLKDTTSQWGSCSGEGNLSFSWRLIFAPLEVARYVVIHEVCHLAEMNHSQRFWALVGSIDPDFKVHRKWLKVHGKKLHAYG